MPKMTIYDLAKQLNLAPSTISKALNNVSGVNEETRKRVVEFAKEIGYFANPTARALKSKKNYTIGILYSEESHVGLEHPFFSPVLQSAKNFLEENGYDLIFINPKANDYSGYSEFCMLRNIAGIFVVSASYNDVLLKDLLNNYDFKIVATDYINDLVPTVLSDNNQAVETLVNHLKNCHFSSVGIMSAQMSVRTFKERQKAFLKQCKENDIQVKEENFIIAEDYTYEAAYKAMNERCKLGNIPQAIFCLSDLYAIGAINALKENHILIPEQCSVFGFDDIELDKYVTPTVSTLRQNAREIGLQAAKLLLAQLNDIEIEEKIIRIQTTLIIRNSSK